MSLKAQIMTDSIGNITIHMRGGLDYENTVPLRLELEQMIRENPARQITLDMQALDFVGSSGIGHFVETLKILNQKKGQIKLANVRSEFLKVFKLYDGDAMQAMIVKFDEDDTEDLSQKFAGRRKTFQN